LEELPARGGGCHRRAMTGMPPLPIHKPMRVQGQETRASGYAGVQQHSS